MLSAAIRMFQAKAAGGITLSAQAKLLIPTNTMLFAATSLVVAVAQQDPLLLILRLESRMAQIFRLLQ
jgi:hypothetical protein